MNQSKTDTEILEEVIKWVRCLSGRVRMYEDNFCACDYADTNVDTAWNYGFSDGAADTANDVLAIIALGRCRNNETN